MIMKNILSSLFLLISLLIYSNPHPIPIDIVTTPLVAAPETSSAAITINEGATVNINFKFKIMNLAISPLAFLP